MTVGAVERFISMEQGLYLVRTGRHIIHAFKGITEDRGIDTDGFPRSHAVDINTENLDCIDAWPDLETGLVLIVCGKHEDDPPVDRFRFDLRGK